MTSQELDDAASVQPRQDASALPDGDQTMAAGLDRSEALRLWNEARRVQSVAETVHERRVVGAFESAVLAHRSLVMTLRLLLRLHGAVVPSDFAELVERASSVAKTESLLTEDLGPDAHIVDEARRRFIDAVEMTAAEERRYDRAFSRSAEWLPAVRVYLDQRLAPPESRIRSKLALGAVAVIAFFVGFIAGRQFPREASPALVPAVAAPTSAPSAQPARRGFTATYYKDSEFGMAAYTRVDQHVAFDWETIAPSEGLPTDHFSVRWTGRLQIKDAGKYTFHLTSDDGSRLFIDDKLVVENWGNHIELMKVQEVQLEAGVHALRVDFYDNIGAALVKLEWSSDHFPLRLISADDLE